MKASLDVDGFVSFVVEFKSGAPQIGVVYKGKQEKTFGTMTEQEWAQFAFRAGVISGIQFEGAEDMLSAMPQYLKTLEEQAKVIGELRTEIANKDSLIDELREAVKKNSVDVEALDALRSSNGDLQGQVGSLQTSLAGAEETITGLRTIIEAEKAGKVVGGGEVKTEPVSPNI